MDQHAPPKKRKILICTLVLLIPLLYSCSMKPKVSTIKEIKLDPIETLTPEEIAKEHLEIPELESPVETVPTRKAELVERFNQPNGPNDLVKYFAEKLMQGELRINLKSLRRELILKGISNTELVEAAQDAALQNPQISLILYPAILMGEKSIGYFAYKTTEELESRKIALEMKVVELLSGIDLTKMSDYDKSLLVHDLVIQNVEYDYEVFEMMQKNREWTVEEWDQMQEASNSYGALIYGKAVCSGYAQAYSLLAKAVGLEAYYMEGLADYNGDKILHAWNRIKIEDQWLVVDTTWDDTETSTNYLWFNQPTSTAYTNRQETENYIKTLDDELIGTSAEYTWFYTNGYYATKDTIINVLAQHVGNKEESFQIFIGLLTDEQIEAIQEEFEARFDFKGHSIFYSDQMIQYASKIPTN
ncbi:MAG: transglutaminase domain-containing protein [Clostridiaceae bacterium]